MTLDEMRAVDPRTVDIEMVQRSSVHVDRSATREEHCCQFI